MTERLTNLAAVKDWLDITNDDSNLQLTRLIDAASQFVLGWLNRDSFQKKVYTQSGRGNGKESMLLRNWPVISIASVGVGGTALTASSAAVNGLPGNGYQISDQRSAPQSLDLYGCGTFRYGAPYQVIYTAGFSTSQRIVIPDAPGEDVYPTVSTVEGGCWSSDLGVTIDGTDAVLVDSEPQAGQYTVDQWGVYGFNPNDVGKVSIITYDYTPWAVQEAVTELIGEWYKRKGRIGLLSKTLGGQETITFSTKDMSAGIQSSLQLYNNVVPV